MAAIDLNALSALDWKQAQTRFQSGLEAGYDEPTAASLYLAPIKAKWDIIGSAPDEFQDPDKLDKINTDFEQAQKSAVDALTGGQLPISIKTTESEWATKPKAPTTLELIRQKRLDRLNNPVPPTPESLKTELSAAKDFYKNTLNPATGATDADKLSAKAYVDEVEKQVRELKSAPAASGTQPQNAAMALLGSVLPSSNPAPAIAPTTATTPDLSAPVPSMPAPAPFYDWLAEKTAETAPAADALTKKPLIYIEGSPLSNVTRAQADAAWGKKFPAKKKAEVVQAVKAPITGTTIRDKKTGKKFVYHGNPSDIPTDTYEILQ